jgi:hypothetical protein
MGLDFENLYGRNTIGNTAFGWMNGSGGGYSPIGPEFTCASQYDLGLGRNDVHAQNIQSYFSWIFVALLCCYYWEVFGRW